MDDCRIIELYWARDQEAITESDRKYGGLCRSISKNIVESVQDAEECVNDTWHRAWTTMPPQRPQSLRAYLSCIVRNLSIDCWRSHNRQKRNLNMESLLGELEDCLPAADGPEQLAEQRELEGFLNRWLGGLSREDRHLFLRRYWYGDPVRDIAQTWNRTPNYVSQRLRRLRLQLKAELEKEGIRV